MEDILRRVNEVIPRYHTLKNQYLTLKRQEHDLIQKISVAKRCVELEPEIKETLEQYQLKKHQESIGLYETLLTDLVYNVLPENAHPIEFDLYMKNNASALDIYLGKGKDRIDIHTATGGSVNNIISAGLRIITLMRSNLRPFILFDEADCWLEVERIPVFARLIHDICTDLGVQTIVISHKKPEVFMDVFNATHQLSKDDSGKIHVTGLAGNDTTWQADQKGIRWLRVKNFMSHEDTLVHFASGSNIIVGPNNHGKSALLQAIRSFSTGEGKDEWIKKECDFYEIEMGLEDGYVMSIRRVLKTSAKTQNAKMVFTLSQNGNILRSGSATMGNVPDFIDNLLNIRRFEDLDVQLLDQKSPIFLLNESATKRAKVLSSESTNTHLQSLMTSTKEMLQSAKVTVRQGELDLAILRREIDSLSHIEQVAEEVIESLLDTAVQLQKSFYVNERASKLLSRWRDVSYELVASEHIHKWDTLHLPNIDILKQSSDLGKKWHALNKRKTHDFDVENFDVIDLPDIKNLKDAEFKLTRWTDLQEILFDLSNLPDALVLPNISPLKDVLVYKKRWDTLKSESITLPVGVDIIELPLDLKNNLEQSVLLGQKYREVKKKTSQLSQEVADLEKEVIALEAEKHACVHENGICVFCHRGDK